MVQLSKGQTRKYVISLPQNQISSGEWSVDPETYMLDGKYFVKLIKNNHTSSNKHHYLLLKTQIINVSFTGNNLNNNTKPDLIYLRKQALIWFLYPKKDQLTCKSIYALWGILCSPREVSTHSLWREKARSKVWYRQVRLPDFGPKNILGSYHIYAPMSVRLLEHSAIQDKISLLLLYQFRKIWTIESNSWMPVRPGSAEAKQLSSKGKCKALTCNQVASGQKK